VPRHYARIRPPGKREKIEVKPISRVAVAALAPLAIAAGVGVCGSAHADPNTDCLTAHNCVVPSEGGQGEAAQQAREGEKKVKQSIHPGGTPGKNCTTEQPVTPKERFCGVVTGNFSGPQGPKDTSPGIPKATGKWDIAVADEIGWATKRNDGSCPRALDFFAEFFANPAAATRTYTDMLVYYRLENAVCTIGEGTFAGPYLDCGVDKDWNTGVNRYVAYVRP
jgi:hypothetical protein